MKMIKNVKNSTATIYIKRGFNNTLGNYYEISAEDNEDSRIFGNYKEELFAGYSLKDSISKYRKNNGLSYKHCDIVDIS